VAGRDPSEEERLLRTWRLVAIATATGLIAFTAIIDSLGRLFVDPTFHVSEILFGSLIGAWLGLLGIEGLTRLRGGRDDD